jgi:glycosyltransferase involved in cell wall biosynthesis
MLTWALSYAGRPRGTQDAVFYLGYRNQDRSRQALVPEGFSERKPLNLLFVGTFGKSYDVKSIIEAIRLLPESQRGRVQCRLVGKGQYLSRWQKLAADLPSITFEGWKDERGLAEMLSVSHVGLIPIRGGVTQFWMGNKLFEYAAFGIALINSVPKEAAALVDQYKFGVNVASGDSQAIAKAISNYLEDPDLLSQHRINANKLFSEKFDAQKIYSDYVDHILKVLPASVGPEDFRVAV